MIELHQDKLRFSFPDVHPDARIDIDLQRTLRIPDDGKDYPLPPGLGPFPLRHLDDFANRVPPHWKERGGVLCPMYQSEALWLRFEPKRCEERDTPYPFAVKIAAGKINAVTGEPWSNGIHRAPQDYVVAPKQPWLDGFCVGRGIIRQFVAMPLGDGYSAEEQLTGEASYGGLQIIVMPMRRNVFEKRFPKRSFPPMRAMLTTMAPPAPSAAMGLGAGGRMKQTIFDDPYGLRAWDTNTMSRCFVHLCNSLTWQGVTGQSPPHPPMTSADYERRGLPWFEHYDDGDAVGGTEELSKLSSITQIAQEKQTNPLPENESLHPTTVIAVGPTSQAVREGNF